ncbi:hypothetical protein [Phenylobacterium sp.]|uniref:hypothetical protein n=1 Tax=Phenylobacterium sp. TaxID=1871053 RepID=UPI0027316499|nr:hypothetical protein [Phenylobacterium sp.]MDP1616023.1 hypothetical protein [Phenylobacterium sp.]MDP1986901.1 hypothetical protein [Phenylobacterium sp.]
MSLHTWVRKIHRWLSLAVTLAVIANVAAMMAGLQVVWIGLMALIPLIPLLATGLYLFALPYLSGRGTSGAVDAS